MAYFGRFVSLMRSENLLCTRICLLNLYQNASKSALKQLKETIMPQKPKKPEAPFLLYVRDVKTRFDEETPSIRYSEILKRASKEWSALNLTEKEYYTNQYNKNFEIYMNKLNEYNNSITDEQKKLWKEKKKEYMKNNTEVDNKKKYEILGKPKKPPNVYFCYLLSKRNDKNPNMSNKEWIKSLTIRWKELSDAEREPYITEATQLRTQYFKDMENWEMKMIQSGHADFVRSKIVTKYGVTKEQEEK